MKKQYIAPNTKAIEMITDDNIAQFVISSHSVGEGEGLAKPGFFEEDEEDNSDFSSYESEGSKRN